MAIHIDSDGNFYFGASGTTDFDNLSYTPVFSVTKDGVLTATSGTVGGISLASDHIKSTNYSTTSGSEAGFKINNNGVADFFDVKLRVKGNSSEPAPAGVSDDFIAIGDSFIYDFAGDLTLMGDNIRIRATEETANSPSLTFAQAYDNPGFYGDDSTVGSAKLYWSNGNTNILHSDSTVDRLYIDASSISVSGQVGQSSQYIGKNSSGTLGWHNLPSGNDHPDSDHSFAASGHDHDSDYYSASAGATLASSLSSHTGHATSLSLLSNTSSDDSGGLFVTSVSGFGIRRTNRAGTTMYTQHIYPKNNPTSTAWSGVYDIGVSPLQAYDDAYIGTVNENSDINIKENIVDVDLGLDFINALTPKKYKLKDFDYENDEGETVTKTHTRTHYGLIAQDVKEVLKSIHPDDYTNDAMFTHLPNDDGEFIGEDSEFDGWALRYRQLIAPLVKAVQELSTQVSDLTARIEALEG